MRIALARALFIEPDLLLLDEPTVLYDCFLSCSVNSSTNTHFTSVAESSRSPCSPLAGILPGEMAKDFYCCFSC